VGRRGAFAITEPWTSGPQPVRKIKGTLSTFINNSIKQDIVRKFGINAVVQQFPCP
jgi:hypothetical protein